jgi:flagellar hook-associated protein 3 FlgL
MRVADISLSQAITDQLGQQQSTIAALEMQMSSGRALNRPSDNPAAVTQVLQLTGQASQLSSWQQNAQTATSSLGVANNAANDTLNAMQSARTLLLQALNQGAQTSAGYQGISEQLSGISASLLAIANTRYEGRPLFAGTSASSQAYDSAGNYLGNTDLPTVVVGSGSGSGETVALSTAGPTLFGSGPSNVFQTLSTVAAQLATGSPTAAQLNTALDSLDANITSAQQASAILGSGSQQVASVTSTLSEQLASVQSAQSTLENVNVATVTTQLNSEMVNYQAAMWAASQAIPETLVHWL